MNEVGWDPIMELDTFDHRLLISASSILEDQKPQKNWEVVNE